MDIRKLQRAIVDGLEDVKAQDKPVRVKLSSPNPFGGARASEPLEDEEDEDDDGPADSRPAPVRKTAAKRRGKTS